MSDSKKSSILYFNGVEITNASKDLMNDIFTADITINLICKERIEQIYNHKRTIHADVLHNPNGELIKAARALMKPTPVEHDFPESWGVAACRKMINKSLIERYTIAGALIAAEIDRIDYLEKEKKARTERNHPITPHYPLTPDQVFKTNENG